MRAPNAYFFYIGDTSQLTDIQDRSLYEHHYTKLTVNDLDRTRGIIGYVKIVLLPGWSKKIPVEILRSVQVNLSCNIYEPEIEFHPQAESYEGKTYRVYCNQKNLFHHLV